MKPWVSRQIEVPLYNSGFWIGFADRVIDFNGRLPKPLDDGRPLEDVYNAVTLWSSPFYMVCFSRPRLDHNTVAHEVFHATHRIMEDRGDHFSRTNHEPYAYLCGWLTAKVYEEARKAKVRVKP